MVATPAAMHSCDSPHPRQTGHGRFTPGMPAWKMIATGRTVLPVDPKGCSVRLLPLSALAAAAVLVPFVAGGSVASAASAAPSNTGLSQRFVHVCAAPAPGNASCHAILAEKVTATGKAAPAASSPSGYNPADLRAAYNLPAAATTTTSAGLGVGVGQTVAIVDAYDDPNAEADLNVYRAQFGIPACTTANGCFRKVNQSGGTHYPRANGGWAQEISLDLDMVSAACPNCHILLVEASSTSLTDLGTAVNEAVKLGATEITNSYGGGESSADSSYDSTYYNHPGIAITASSGDSGYGVEYPAASQYVTAVGGTRLARASTSRGWDESVWSTSTTEGAGSGCSAYDTQPTWQASVTNVTSACSKRAVADVAAVADPATGVSVYDSYSYSGQSGWLVVGGTSVASPIIASVYALAGNAATVSYSSFPYSHTSSLNDVTQGSTANCGTSLCTAGTGWDGPTGLGTPNGTGGF